LEDKHMQSDIHGNPGVIQTGAQDIALQQSRVLRNTYLLLALTMVQTAIGAFIGIGTGVIFFVMAGIATTVKKDFSFMGKFLFVGMIVALLAIIANMFLQIPVLALTISAIVVVVFALFLLHDVSRIVNGGETNYIMAATGCYLSLFNIFAHLRHLYSTLGGERD